ncbi:MAG: hypothetical protein JNJ99_08245, partial [Crocinitomicaceae bacterium]|nr:hypothetical protein [Crocinitomicaceae bacterium]
AFLCTYKNEREDYYKFYTYNASADKFAELPTDLSITDNITGERIYSHKPGEFIFSGMYVDKNALPNKSLQGLMMNGHFYYKTTEPSAWSVKIKELYDSTHYENIFKNQVKADEIPFLGSCPLRYRFTRTDGREIWILENIHMTKVSEMAPGSTTATYTYTNYSNALIIFCINQESGKIEWVNRLEKNQKEISKDNVIHHIHSIPYLQNDTLYVIWNNTELNDAELKGTWKEADGQSYDKVNTFGARTLYAPFLRAYDLNGKDIYSEFKYGLPLSGIFKNQDTYDLALNSAIYANRDANALYVIAQFNKGFKYQFIEIRF